MFRGPKFWILSSIAARCAYLAMNEYGLNPFKKALKDEHVFLTGAGGGIGRPIAVRLGKLGARLTITSATASALA